MDPMKGIYGVIIVILVFLIIQQLYKNNPTIIPMNIFKDQPKNLKGPFWPQSGQAYKPKRSGSGGPSPTGGERDPGPYIQPSIGWWGGEIEQVTNTVQHIYDEKGIPEKKVWEIGWWGY